jgi:hypothetical protein
MLLIYAFLTKKQDEAYASSRQLTPVTHQQLGVPPCGIAEIAPKLRITKNRFTSQFYYG